MKIKMTQDAPGSPDGVTVNDYKAGEQYDVPEDLGNVFIAEGFATLDVVAPDVPILTPEPGASDQPKADSPSENK